MRRKLALAMALTMVLTSVPVNTLTGFAEEVIVEEAVVEDFVEEAAYDEAEVLQDFESQILDEGAVVELDLGENLEEAFDADEEADVEMPEATDAEMEWGEVSDTAFTMDDIVIEAVEEVEEPINLEQYEEVQEEVQEVLESASDGDEAETQEDMIIQEGIDLSTAILVDETTFPEVIEVGEEGYVVYKFVPTEPSTHCFWYNDIDDEEDSIPYGYLYKYTPENGLWCWVNAGRDSEYGAIGGHISAYGTELNEGDALYIVLAPGKAMTFGTFMKSLYVNIEKTDYEYNDVVPGDSVTLGPIVVSGKDVETLCYSWEEDSEIPQEPLAVGKDCTSYTINNVTKSGKYKCYVYPEEDPGMGECIYFTVNIDTGLVIDYDYDTDYWNYVKLGESKTLSVNATTTVGEISYKWYSSVDNENWEQIEDVEESSLTVTETGKLGEIKYYKCEVSNDYTIQPEVVQFLVEVVEIEEDLELDYEGNPKLLIGEGKVLEVKAESYAGDPKYQWYIWDEEEGYVKIENATSSALEIPANTAVGLYEYKCVVANNTDIDDAIFYVEIANLLLDYENWHYGYAGDSVELSIHAKAPADAELTYKWYRCVNVDEEEEEEYEEIKGETSSVLKIEKLEGFDDQHYKCEVYSNYTAQPETVWFSIEVSPVEVDLELNYDDWVQLLAGEGKSLEVKAESYAGEPKYQWYILDEEEGYVKIENATSSTLEIPAEQSAGSYSYKCEVTNDTDCDNAYIEVEIVDILVDYEYINYGAIGGSVELAVSARTTAGPLSYQWYRCTEDGTYEIINGATDSVFTVEKLEDFDKKFYKCEISAGEYKKTVVLSAAARHGESDLILQYDDDVSVMYGNTEGTALNVTAFSRNGEPSYQWYVQEYDYEEGEPVYRLLEGETGASLKLPENLDAKYYYYRCVVTNKTDQDEAEFVVSVNKINLRYDSEVLVTYGSTVELTVEADSTQGELKYQWYRMEDDGESESDSESALILLEGETNSTLKLIEQKETGHQEYRCVVSAGEYSKTAYIDVYVEYVEDALVLDYEETKRVIKGQVKGTVLSVKAVAANETPVFRWYLEGELIEGASGSELTINDELQEGLYYYRCDVSVGNDVDKAYFYVTVGSGLEVNMVSPTVDDYYYAYPGETVKLEVAAVSELSDKFTYQWYVYVERYDDFRKIYGETGKSMSIAATEENYYKCEVSDGISTEKMYFDLYIDSGLTVDVVRDVKEAELGSEVALEVKAESKYGNVPTYRWYYEEYDSDEIEVSREATYSFVLNEAKALICEVTDGYTKEYIHFTVNVITDLTVETASENIIKAAVGETAALTVKASSRDTYGPIRYEWKKLDYDEWEWYFAGGINDTLNITVSDEIDTYLCEISDAYNTEYVYFYVASEEVLEGTAILRSQAAEMKLGANTAVFPKNNTVMWFKFVPEKTGTYKLYGEKQDLWYAYIFEGNNPDPLYMHPINPEFERDLSLTAGNEYYIQVGRDGVEGSSVFILEEVATHTHSYPSAWTTTLAASCTKDGSQFRECSGCHEVETQIIPATGHTYGEVQKDENDSVIREYIVCGTCGDEVTVSVKAAEKEQDKIDAATDVMKELTEAIEAGTSADVSAAVDAVTSMDNEILIGIEETAPEGTATAMQLIADLEEKLVSDSTGITGTIEASAVKENADNASETLITQNVTVTGAAVTVASVLKAAEGAENTKKPDASSTYKAELEIKEDTTAAEEPGVYNIDISMNIIEKNAEGTSTFAEDVQPAAPLYITIPVPTAFWEGTFELRHKGTKVNYVRNEENQTISFYAASLSPWSLELTECADESHNYLEDTARFTAATCKAPGTKVFVCGICKDEQHEVIPRAAHKTVHTAAVAETCGTAGNKEYWTCSECGKYLADAAGKFEITKESTVTAATGTHSWTTVTDKAATCGTAGSQHQECTVCKTKQAAASIPATGKHTWTTVVDKAATCGAAGSQHQECTVCKTLQAATSIPATGKHVYANDYKVTKEATCLAEGSKTRSCTVCNGAPQTEEIKKLAGTVTPAASKLTLGLKKSVKASKLVSGLMDGDYITNVTTSKSGFVAVKKSGSDWTITGKKVTSKKKDNADITITLASGASAKITFSVQKNAVATSSLKVTNANKKLTLTVGEKLTLETVVKPVTTSDKLTFTTSDKKVVTVSKSGQIVAKKAGKATVTVKSGKKSYKITVTVKKTAPTDFTLSKTTLNLKVNKSATLKVKFKPNGSEGKVTFKSSAPKIASVNKTTGKVTAKKNGTATITATVKSATGEVLTRTCTVVVKK